MTETRLTEAEQNLLKRAAKDSALVRIGTPSSARAQSLVAAGFLKIIGVRVGRLRYTITPAGRALLEGEG